MLEGMKRYSLINYYCYSKIRACWKESIAIFKSLQEFPLKNKIRKGNFEFNQRSQSWKLDPAKLSTNGFHSEVTVKRSTHIICFT